MDSVHSTLDATDWPLKAHKNLKMSAVIRVGLWRLDLLSSDVFTVQRRLKLLQSVNNIDCLIWLHGHQPMWMHNPRKESPLSTVFAAHRCSYPHSDGRGEQLHRSYRKRPATWRQPFYDLIDWGLDLAACHARSHVLLHTFRGRWRCQCTMPRLAALHCPSVTEHR